MGFPYLANAFISETCLNPIVFKSVAFANGRADTLIVKWPAFSVLIVLFFLTARATWAKTSRFFLLMKYWYKSISGMRGAADFNCRDSFTVLIMLLTSFKYCL